jgi:hypothetical protein
VLPDPEHVEILRLGPKAWNIWRKQSAPLVPQLSGVALTLGERQMGPASGGPINLAYAKLKDASFRFATLSGANLERADLSGADLTNARLDGANLSYANLTGALLDHADLADAKLMMANLSGASLQTARGLIERQLFSTIGNTATSLPQYLQRPLSWSETERHPLLDQALEHQSASPKPKRRVIVSALTGAGAAIAAVFICLLAFQATHLLMAPNGRPSSEPQITATAGPPEARVQVRNRLHLITP